MSRSKAAINGTPQILHQIRADVDKHLQKLLRRQKSMQGECYFGSGQYPRIRICFPGVRVLPNKPHIRSDLTEDEQERAKQVCQKALNGSRCKLQGIWSDDNYVSAVIVPG